MASQAKLEKMEMRQRYQNFWHTDLLSATTDDPFFCCFALWCGPCASYVLRKRALYNDMSRYTCCGGYMPCSGHCGESKCPEFCLCTEVFLFFANSVASTRFMIQDEFNIRTTKCDNCIIGCMFCLQQLACIFSLIACIVGSDEIEEASQLLNCLADMVYCSVCPCMQTQHKIELDKRDGKFGGAPAMAVPTVQQMSRLDQHLPPPVGFLPPAASSYPPPPQAQGSFPPPQFNGYPPLPQSYGHPPQTQGYYLPPQAYGFHPPPQGHGPPLEFPPSQAQGFSPASHFHGYPTPPPQSQGSPPWPPLQSSPPQAQGFPPPLQSHEHPPPPPVQGYTPPSAAPPTGHPG